MFGISAFFSWKSKRRVTSYELRGQIHELRAQIYQLRVQIHELRVQIHELRVQICQLQVQIHELRVQIHEFSECFTQASHEDFEKSFPQSGFEKYLWSPKLPTYFSIGHKIRTY